MKGKGKTKETIKLRQGNNVTELDPPLILNLQNPRVVNIASLDDEKFFTPNYYIEFDFIWGKFNQWKGTVTNFELESFHLRDPLTGQELINE